MANQNPSQTDLKFATVALNAEGAGVLAEDAKAIIFLCDLCEILRVLCVETPSCEGKDPPEVFTGFANSESKANHGCSRWYEMVAVESVH